MKILKRLKPNFKNKQKIYGFDVETYQTKREHEKITDGFLEQHFYMGSVVGDDYEKVCYNKDEFAKLLTSKKFRNCLLLATNLDFDFRHTFQNTKYDAIAKKTVMQGAIINAKITINDNVVKFGDTLNYHKASVEELGKILKLPKLEHPDFLGQKPKNQREENILRKYNIRDSEISQKFGLLVQDFCNDLGCKMKGTIASTGLDNWRRNFQPIDIFQEREEWIIKHFLGSFSGGRTEVIKRGYTENVFLYDYNSHYPACCVKGYNNKGSYPNPSSVMYQKKGSVEIIEDYEGISFVTIKVNYSYLPILGTKYNGKYIFPHGIIKGWYTNIELRKAINNNCEILEVGEVIYYTYSFKPFVKIVPKLYKLRQDYKAKNNPLEKMCKTMMNSGLFGKFGQRIEGFEEELHIDNIKVNSNGHLCFDDGKSVRLLKDATPRLNSVFVKQQKQKIPIFIMPILASYTTAIARLKLWEDMQKHQKYLIGGDTDSMFLTKKRICSSKDLGALQLEDELIHHTAVRPKMYMNQDINNKFKVKIKGVAKKHRNIEGWEKLLRGETVYSTRFTKQKESGVRKVPYSSIIKVPKKLSLCDNKRLWSKKFNPTEFQDSEPLKI